MQYRFNYQFCLMLGLADSTTQALAQVAVRLSPSDSNDTYSLTASNLPTTGVAVIWRSTDRLAKGDHWSAAHAFPARKLESAALTIKPGGTGVSFFKLTWQGIAVPKNMIWLSPGDFLMGSPEEETGRFMDEGPVRSVTIPHGFWMDRYEVTQQRFNDIMGSNPSSTEFTPDLPVNKVTWHEAREFCRRTTEQERSRGTLPIGYLYRLPTEAEWEYACRAGTTTMYSFGDDPALLGEHAWHEGNSDFKYQKVGTKKPNPWGLHDMHGNVWEWVEDCWHESYAGAPSDTNVWKAGDCSRRVLRGGSWRDGPYYVRSASRRWLDIESRFDNFGFRISRTLP